MIEAAFCELDPLLGTRSACAAVGRPRATHYRRRRPAVPHPPAARPTPPNALSGAERQVILDALRSPRFVDLSPAQVFYILLDEGTYLGSVSTMYRLLRTHDEVHERRCQATHPPRVRPELVARGRTPFGVGTSRN